MRHRGYFDETPLRGLYRDPENGYLFGVCAGLAERFNLNVTATRFVAVLSLLFFFWPTAIAYLAASLLIRQKPLIYSGDRAEYEFWRHHDHWRRS